LSGYGYNRSREDADATELDWNGGNAEKNWLVAEDNLHSHGEARYFALGRTDLGRLLVVIYTLRGEKVRIISARDMTRREQKEYEHAQTQEFETDSQV
jgi:uncharacterized protein